MPTEIWTVDCAGELADLYNARIQSLPYAYSVSPDTLVQAAQFRQEDVTENECLIVGLEGTAPKAFAQIGDLILNDPEGIPEELREFYTEGGGLIRRFLAHPQYLGMAQDVLSKVEDIFRDRGQKKIWASDDSDYHFYRCAGSFPADYWPVAWFTDYQLYTLPLFSLNGYDIKQKGICFHLPDYDLAEPSHDDDGIQVRLSQQEGNITRPNLNVEVVREADVICQVLISSLEFSEPYQSQACFIDGFGTAELERRKGIGRYAMEVALTEMRKLGFKHVVLDVLSDNYPAQLMYLSMGFQKLSNTYNAKKKLDDYSTLSSHTEVHDVSLPVTP